MRKSVAVFRRTERCGIVATGSPCLGVADAERAIEFCMLKRKYYYPIIERRRRRQGSGQVNQDTWCRWYRASEKEWRICKCRRNLQGQYLMIIFMYSRSMWTG